MFRIGLLLLSLLGGATVRAGVPSPMCIPVHMVCHGGITFCANQGVCHAGDGGCAKCCCQPGYAGNRCSRAVAISEEPSVDCRQRIATTAEPVTHLPGVVEDTPTENFTCGNAQKGSMCSNNGVCDPMGLFKCNLGSADQASGCCHRCETNCTNGFCKPERQDNGVFLPKCHCFFGYVSVNNTCIAKCEVDPDHPDCVQGPVILPDLTKMYIAIGCSVGVVFLLLILFGVSLYFFYKRKNKWALKFIYKLSRYEDNDSLKYDVFLSYKARDVASDFVINHMFPLMEEEWGYDVCLHERDFVPGRAIAENIAETMSQSRRVVLVLTHEFVTSEWCRYEYMAAQQLMLKRKTRIIPVMFEDITQHPDLDDNLRYIINHVTYLSVPPEERSRKNFWERLRYALPKTRAAEKRSKQTAGGCCVGGCLQGRKGGDVGGERVSVEEISVEVSDSGDQQTTVLKRSDGDGSLTDSGRGSEVELNMESTNM